MDGGGAGSFGVASLPTTILWKPMGSGNPMPPAGAGTAGASQIPAGQAAEVIGKPL